VEDRLDGPFDLKKKREGGENETEKEDETAEEKKR
jgi:hypothetical protein